MKNKFKKGFTLVELLVVVAILGVLAVVGIVAFGGYTSAAKKAAAEANYTNIEKRLSSVIISCMSGMEISLGPFQNRSPNTWTCTSQFLNADQLAWNTYLEVKDKIKNPYNTSSTSAVDWSNGTCPPTNLEVGQIKIGYAHKNNYCGMAGNTACIKVNIGDTDNDGNDNYLEKEFNLCEY